MGELLAGVDLGTTGTKVVLFEPGRGVVGAASRPSSLHSGGPGFAEADVGQWWDNVCALLVQAAAAAGVSTAAISGVATSGMVPAVVVLDAEHRPLHRAILQNDARAVREIGEIQAVLEDESYDVLARTGSALTQQSVAPTWRWLARHEPAVAERAGAIVGSYDWLAIRLGAPVHVEANWALESGLYEFAPDEGTLELAGHAEPVRRAAGVPNRLCPPVHQPGSVAGEVSAEAAEATGLRAGIPIYTGGADHVLAAYAAGLREPGDWLIKLGGAADILVVADAPVIDRRWYLDAHPAPGLWLPNGCMATSGSLLRWFQTLVGGVALGQLDLEAENAAPASVICLPYFLGEKSPLHDPDLRGAFIGLSLQHSRGDLFRSCMEAVAYGVRHHVDVFESAGITLGAARVSNGGSGSKVWKQILADVVGRELTSIVAQGGASLGAALVAAVGSGALADWRAASEYVELGKLVEPRVENAASYGEGYAMYQQLQGMLTPVSHRLATWGRP